MSSHHLYYGLFIKLHYTIIESFKMAILLLIQYKEQHESN